MKNQFEQLVGEDLSGVTFVRDYVQLQFNPPVVLSVYTPMAIRTSRGEAAGQETFPSFLVGQINKYVVRVDFNEGQNLVIAFEDGSSALVSLRPEHYVGAEAVNLVCKDGTLVVE